MGSGRLSSALRARGPSLLASRLFGCRPSSYHLWRYWCLRLPISSDTIVYPEVFIEHAFLCYNVVRYFAVRSPKVLTAIESQVKRGAQWLEQLRSSGPMRPGIPLRDAPRCRQGAITATR